MKISLRIDWSDLDLFGHVNNVVFYRFIQTARVEFWKQIELYSMYEEQGIAPLLVSASIDFKRPLHFPGNAHIHFLPAFVKNTSFGLQYEILNDQDEVCAKGSDAMVLFDFKHNKKLPIPDRLRANINSVP